MKMQFWAFNTATAKCHIYLAGKDHLLIQFFKLLAVQEVRFLIITYKKLYRKQPVLSF